MSADTDRALDGLIASAVEALSDPPPAAAPVVSRERFVEAAETCRLIAARHSRTFYLASALLPPEKRRDIRCLYAFCRTTDDIVDQADAAPRQRLEQWETQALAEAPDPESDVLVAWHDVRRRCGIPGLFARQLVEAVAADIGPVRYGTFGQLAGYCYGVASTVGLMSMCILGYAGPEAVPYAVKLGIALQLTNILRDVGEDWAKGRLYLPAEDLARFGVTEGQIQRGEVDGAWRELMRFEIARNRRLYEEAWPGITLLHPDGQFAVAAAARLYAAILEDIERHDYQVFQRRAHVGGVGKLARLPGVWRGLRRLQRAGRPGAVGRRSGS
jgi:phytoene synthase